MNLGLLFLEPSTCVLRKMTSQSCSQVLYVFTIIYQIYHHPVSTSTSSTHLHKWQVTEALNTLEAGQAAHVVEVHTHTLSLRSDGHSWQSSR